MILQHFSKTLSYGSHAPYTYNQRYQALVSVNYHKDSKTFMVRLLVIFLLNLNVYSLYFKTAIGNIKN